MTSRSDRTLAGGLGLGPRFLAVSAVFMPTAYHIEFICATYLTCSRIRCTLLLCNGARMEDYDETCYVATRFAVRSGGHFGCLDVVWTPRRDGNVRRNVWVMGACVHVRSDQDGRLEPAQPAHGRFDSARWLLPMQWGIGGMEDKTMTTYPLVDPAIPQCEMCGAPIYSDAYELCGACCDIDQGNPLRDDTPPTFDQLATIIREMGETVSCGSWEDDWNICVFSAATVPNTYGHPKRTAMYSKRTGWLSITGRKGRKYDI